MNEILTSLCNRGHGFASACYPVRSSFVPRALSEAAHAAREFMGLHRTDTDFYTDLCLGVLLSEPDLCTAFGETQRTYLPGRLLHADYQVTGAQLVTHNSTRACVRRTAAEWPVDEKIELRVLSPNSMQISVAGQVAEIPVAWTGSRWVGSWPEWSGLYGAIRPDSELSTTPTSFTIHHKPAMVRMDAITAAIEGNEHCRTILMLGGVESRFFEIVNPRRALALFLQTLALQNS